MLGAIASVLGKLVEFGSSVVGVRRGIEEPPYTVEQQIDGVEIRCYGPRLAAETAVQASEVVARNEGFRRLARYIFGANHAAVKIAMTAPVAQQSGSGQGQKIAMTAPVQQRPGVEGEWVVRFFMPADKTMESLPEPDDDTVKLVTVPEEIVAVRRFTGSYSRRAIAAQTAELRRALALQGEKGFEPTGPPATWFYDPPWTIPPLRRNEVVIPVKRN